MLSGLSIRNVVLIESLELDFSAGMTALTGETGAGKSIILDALGMATGARSDRGLVRKGCDKAQCTASFELPPDHSVWHILEKAGLDIDPSEPLILRRQISSDGRSKAFINDMAISVKLLSEVGIALLEVHGQHDGRGLLDPGRHIHMLDAFGGYESLLSRVGKAFSEMNKLQEDYENLKAKAETAESERDFLVHAVEELDRLDVRAGEEEELATKRRFLQGAEGALTELTSAETVLGEGDYESRLATVLSGIERVRDKAAGNEAAQNVLTLAGEALERALLETQEARHAVATAAQTFNVEPGALDATEKRLFAIKAACRKYGVQGAALIDKRREFVESLELIDNVDGELKKAEIAAGKAETEYRAAAFKLTQARQGAAIKLQKAVIGELPSLKMERAKFEAQINEGSASILGQDRVRFVVATNPGSAMGPMDKVASGGELARFALAIKVALAGSNQKAMVFDEVDQGVGGAVASAVGKRLSVLSSSGQVFVVTHSPQVAAFADQQYRIEKASGKTKTVTSVTPVSRDDREEEIARMLAGEQITDEARAAARQLMKAS